MSKKRVVAAPLAEVEWDRLHALCAAKGWRPATALRSMVSFALEHQDQLRAVDYVASRDAAEEHVEEIAA